MTLHYITKTNQSYTLLDATNYDSRSLLNMSKNSFFALRLNAGNEQRSKHGTV